MSPTDRIQSLKGPSLLVKSAIATPMKEMSLSQKLNQGLQEDYGLIKNLPGTKSIQYLQGADVILKDGN